MRDWGRILGRWRPASVGYCGLLILEREVISKILKNDYKQVCRSFNEQLLILKALRPLSLY